MGEFLSFLSVIALWVGVSGLVWWLHQMHRSTRGERRIALARQAASKVAAAQAVFNYVRHELSQAVPAGDLPQQTQALLKRIQKRGDFFDGVNTLRPQMRRAFNEECEPLAEILHIRRDLWAASEIVLIDDFRKLGPDFDDDEAYAQLREEAVHVLLPPIAKVTSPHDLIDLRLSLARDEAKQFVADVEEAVFLAREQERLPTAAEVIAYPVAAARAMPGQARNARDQAVGFYRQVRAVAVTIRQSETMIKGLDELRRARAELPQRVVAGLEKTSAAARQSAVSLRGHYDFLVKAYDFQAKYEELIHKAPELTERGKQFIARLELADKSERLKLTSATLRHAAMRYTVRGLAHLIAGSQRLLAGLEKQLAAANAAIGNDGNASAVKGPQRRKRPNGAPPTDAMASRRKAPSAPALKPAPPIAREPALGPMLRLSGAEPKTGANAATAPLPRLTLKESAGPARNAGEGPDPLNAADEWARTFDQNAFDQNASDLTTPASAPAASTRAAFATRSAPLAPPPMTLRGDSPAPPRAPSANDMQRAATPSPARAAVGGRAGANALVVRPPAMPDEAPRRASASGKPRPAARAVESGKGGGWWPFAAWTKPSGKRARPPAPATASAVSENAPAQRPAQRNVVPVAGKTAAATGAIASQKSGGWRLLGAWTEPSRKKVRPPAPATGPSVSDKVQAPGSGRRNAELGAGKAGAVTVSQPKTARSPDGATSVRAPTASKPQWDWFGLWPKPAKAGRRRATADAARGINPSAAAKAPGPTSTNRHRGRVDAKAEQSVKSEGAGNAARTQFAERGRFDQPSRPSDMAVPANRPVPPLPAAVPEASDPAAMPLGRRGGLVVRTVMPDPLFDESMEDENYAWAEKMARSEGPESSAQPLFDPAMPSADNDDDYAWAEKIAQREGPGSSAQPLLDPAVPLTDDGDYAWAEKTARREGPGSSTQPLLDPAIPLTDDDDDYAWAAKMAQRERGESSAQPTESALPNLPPRAPTRTEMREPAAPERHTPPTMAAKTVAARTKPSALTPVLPVRPESDLPQKPKRGMWSARQYPPQSPAPASAPLADTPVAGGTLPKPAARPEPEAFKLPPLKLIGDIIEAASDEHADEPDTTGNAEEAAAGPSKPRSSLAAKLTAAEAFDTEADEPDNPAESDMMVQKAEDDDPGPLTQTILESRARRDEKPDDGPSRPFPRLRR